MTMLNFPFPWGSAGTDSNDTTQENCDIASISAMDTCHNNTGALCIYEVRTVRPYECITQAGIGTATTNGNNTCFNATTAEFCPPGSYCVGGFARSCPAGQYCPLGTGDPVDCPFVLMSCPLSNMSEPYVAVVFFMLLLVFCSLFGAYWMYGKNLLRNDQLHEKSERIARVVSTRRHDPVNALVLAHDQHALVQATEDLYQSATARAKYTASGRWQVPTTNGHNTANNRFSRSGSSDVSSLEAASPVVLNLKRLSLKPEAHKGGKVARENSRLMRKLQASLGEYEYEEVDVPLTVSFMNMSMVLKVSKDVILDNICVSIEPCNVTAIMGPSGAGKTSLLSLLRGQAHYATTTGNITVNGHKVENLTRFKKRTAYVPQEDIVNDDLSVEENILYSALLFNRRGFLKPAEVMPMVLRAEKLLDISHIRTSVVGNAAKRGISGGQKKRVSIGMELMKEAELFFLDEPTSGLDSASSMLVVNALHFLASKGVNVATTIHQPRQEIINLMDKLLLLAPGGRVAYFGPIIDLQRHFSSLRFTCPPGTNIADYVMDTLCGFVPEDGQSDVKPVHETIATVCNRWSLEVYPQHSANFSNKASTLKSFSSLQDLESLPHPHGGDKEWRYTWFPQYMKVLYACMDRQVKTNIRTIDGIWTTCYLLLVFGIIVAHLIGPMALDDSSASVSTMAAQVTSGGLVFSLLVQAASLKLFSNDQLLREREFNAGVPVAPYFLGKVIGNYCEGMFYAFAFLVGYYPFLQARAPFIEYWYTFLLLHLAISGMVNCIAVAYPGANKGTFAVGCVVLLWSFGGVSPPLDVMQKSMSVFALVLNYVSPFKYSFELEILNELVKYPAVWGLESLYDRWGYHVSDRDGCVGALICYFVVTNLCAYGSAEVKIRLPGIKRNFQVWANTASSGAINFSSVKDYNLSVTGSDSRSVASIASPGGSSNNSSNNSSSHGRFTRNTSAKSFLARISSKGNVTGNTSSNGILTRISSDSDSDLSADDLTTEALRAATLVTTAQQEQQEQKTNENMWLPTSEDGGESPRSPTSALSDEGIQLQDVPVQVEMQQVRGDAYSHSLSSKDCEVGDIPPPVTVVRPLPPLGGSPKKPVDIQVPALDEP